MTEENPNQTVQIKKTEKGSRSDYDIAYEHDRVTKKKFRLRVVYNRKGSGGE